MARKKKQPEAQDTASADVEAIISDETVSVQVTAASEAVEPISRDEIKTQEFFNPKNMIGVTIAAIELHDGSLLVGISRDENPITALRADSEEFAVQNALGEDIS